MLMTSGGVGSRVMTLGQKEYAYALICVWMCMYLLDCCFVYGVMKCCGNVIFRFCFIL